VDVYQTEQEQVEAIKKWWKENGKAVILGVVVGLAGLVGGRMWIEHKQGRAETASLHYEAMMQKAARGEADAVLQQGGQIVQQFGGTPYASLAALAMAKVKVEQGDSAAAGTHLRWVMEHTEQKGLEHIARLRLAELLIGDGQYAAALDLVATAEQGGYAASYEELKGDIYLATGVKQKARDAYVKALAGLPPNAGSRGLLQMKLDDLSATEGMPGGGP